jgi:hypothetical protein
MLISCAVDVFVRLFMFYLSSTALCPDFAACWFSFCVLSHGLYLIFKSTFPEQGVMYAEVILPTFHAQNCDALLLVLCKCFLVRYDILGH